MNAPTTDMQRQHLAELRSDYARALAGDESVRSEYPIEQTGRFFGDGSARPSLGRIMFMCRQSAMQDFGIDLQADV